MYKYSQIPILLSNYLTPSVYFLVNVIPMFEGSVIWQIT